MRTAAVVVGLVFFSISVLASEFLMNDETAMGLQVVFSAPVTITDFGDVFTNVAPEGEASEFLFYGAELAPWFGHWLNWEPSSASLVRSEWLSEPPCELDEEASQREVEIVGQLLSAAYFAHPAYVMQGVSDREKAFAMPLGGIPELDFYPVRSGVSSDVVCWSVEVNDPELIEAVIKDGTLYIWASTNNGVGVSSAKLIAQLPSGEEAQAGIPVTVFRSDKTLTWLSGEKNYFVPWSSQLDINRILSVRRHAAEYGFDDLSRLDSTVRFSRWRPMPRLRDVEKSLYWDNELVSNGFWPKAAQLRLTTAFLMELAEFGVDAIRVEVPWYIEGITGTEIYPVYDRREPGPTLRPDEYAYFVNEAHRFGMMVIDSPQLAGDPGSEGQRAFESYEFIPSDLNVFWDNYRGFMRSEIQVGIDLGVDFLATGLTLHLFDLPPGKEQQNDGQISRTIALARELYPGPVIYFGGSLWYRIGNTWNGDFRFWEDVDILSTGLEHTLRPLTCSSDPILEDLVKEWEWRIDEYFEPFQAKYDKPLLGFENGCYSAEGSLPWGGFLGTVSGLNVYGLPVSMRDQELHFESFLMAFEDEDWFYGPGFFWVHFGPGDQMGGINDVSMTFRCKPAEEVMARYYNPVWTPPLNRQDGSTEDWPDTALFIDDLPGDSAGEDEILSFASYEDDKYVRFAIRYSERPLGNFTIWLDATGDGKADYLLSSGPTIPDFPVEVFFRSSAFGDWSRTEMLGAADSATVGGTVEIRLNKVFMPEDCDGALTVWLEDHNAEWSALDDAIKGHHIIPVIPSEEEG